MTISNDRVTISSSVISDSFTDEAQRLISTTQSLHAVVSDSMTTVFTISNGIAEPSNQPTGLQFANVTSTSFDVSFTASVGGADGYVAFRRSGASPTFVPVDTTTYTVGNSYGDSTCAHFGSGTSFSESGLSASTTYYYDVFAWNGAVGTYNYLTTSPLEGNQLTLYSFVNAIHLDGSNDRIDTTVTTFLNGATKASWLFWFKADTSIATTQYICQRSNNSGSGGFAVRFQNPNTMVCFIGDGAIAVGSVAIGVTATNWNFYEVYYDGTLSGNSNRLKIYINGVQKTLSFSGTVGASIVYASSKPMTIGAFRNDSAIYSGFTDGSIDDLAIYTTADQTNGSTMYNSGNGAPPPSTGRVRWYKFDETDPSTTATDTDGNDNGTLVNFNFDANSGRVTH